MSNEIAESLVGQLVSQRPARARIFDSFGIDYCCGGGKSLAAACSARNLDVDTVVAVLRAFDAEAAAPADSRDWTKASMAELCDHIEQTHHAYLKQELPRLEQCLRKIAARHGPGDARLVELLDVFLSFRAELEQHAMKEERILFPLIRRLEAGDSPTTFHCGSVNNPIRVMVMEHDHAGAALARMRDLTDGYQAPPDACNTYRSTMDAMLQLERDMHRHVHKENSILFPRAAEAEAKAACAS
ncbi:MAG TPA: iron-sulfur cluster repair di-iron protein [Tepidisphaeraceae bacterium]|jgi:regulator of cell morphogenesis and NO signaling